MTPKRIELLQRMPIFGAIGTPALEHVVERARPVQMPRGQDFFREGDGADSMFVLETGSVEVFKTWQGRDLVVRELGPGDCFGEMALIDLAPRSATVRALQDCDALEISAADLLSLFERDAEQFALIQMNLAREISRRLRITDELLFRLWIGADAAGDARPNLLRST